MTPESSTVAMRRHSRPPQRRQPGSSSSSARRINAALDPFDGGMDIRPEVLDSIAPAVARLGIEFPSLDTLLGLVRSLPMFEGRWND